MFGINGVGLYKRRISGSGRQTTRLGGLVVCLFYMSMQARRSIEACGRMQQYSHKISRISIFTSIIMLHALGELPIFEPS